MKDSKFSIAKAVKSIFVVRIGKLISVCPGKRHAWYESNVGIIRKPVNK